MYDENENLPLRKMKYIYLMQTMALKIEQALIEYSSEMMKFQGYFL